MDLQERINKANNQMLTGDDPVGAPAQTPPEPQPEAPMPQPTDYYQMQANAAQQASQSPTAYGSPAEMGQVVDSMVKEASEKYYNAYKHQYDHLVDTNDMNGAKQLANEYMMHHALPIIASLVEMYGADALVNNKGALEKLDTIMLTGNGAGDGYTKAFLKKMYSQILGTRSSSSDAEVVRGLQKATGIAEQGDIRSAVGIAKGLKEKIDRGELSASPEDYSTLIRVTEVK